MLAETVPSHLSQAILEGRKLEKAFFRTHIAPIDRERKRIHLNADRHMETFLRITRKRHEGWYRHDKYFRDALQKEKDRHEAHKQRCGSSANPARSSFPSLVAINSLPDGSTKTEQRTNQVLRAAQKLLDEAAASRSPSPLNHSRPSTSKSFSSRAPGSSSSYQRASVIVPMTQSINVEEYTRLMNSSLQRETYGDFVDHFVKFRPQFREQFGQFHQGNQRRTAVERLRAFNQTYGQQKDGRYYNLINSMADFRLGHQWKPNKI